MPPEEQTPEQRLADLERREAILRSDRMKGELQQALRASKCRPEALADATAVMYGACESEFDDDGRIAKLTVGGAAYANVADATAAFLEARAYFVDSAQPASSQTGPTSGPKAEQVVADAWTRPSPAPKHTVKTKQTNESLENLLKSGHSAADLASEGWATPPK